MFHERFQDSEKRRDQAARDRANASVPIEQGGAQLLSHRLTATPEVPQGYILLTFVDNRGEPIKINGDTIRCVADLIIGAHPMRPTALMLVLVCPRCMQRGDRHLQDNQLVLKQWLKNFEFKAALGPPTFTFDGQVYRSAGTIVQSESFRCPDCHWRARIDMNRVYSD